MLRCALQTCNGVACPSAAFINSEIRIGGGKLWRECITYQAFKQLIDVKFVLLPITSCRIEKVERDFNKFATAR